MSDQRVKRPVGAPVKIESGRRVNAWLDPDTIERMRDYGDGNISEGIRKAARLIPADHFVVANKMVTPAG